MRGEPAASDCFATHLTLPITDAMGPSPLPSQAGAEGWITRFGAAGRARARSTETSCETPRSAIVTPKRRSTRAIAM
ncbi:MAG TPA: hypothetical protein VN849_10425 [Stellaceae bacterium]|nr:hypothetical protein [Stellaceae bacterium]